jgi:hypothetical protein
MLIPKTRCWMHPHLGASAWPPSVSGKLRCGNPQAAIPEVVQLLPLDPADRLIVATAAVHGLPLASHD